MFLCVFDLFLLKEGLLVVLLTCVDSFSVVLSLLLLQSENSSFEESSSSSEDSLAISSTELSSASKFVADLTFIFSSVLFLSECEFLTRRCHIYTKIAK